jgi:RecA-family ATPase
MLVSPGGMGKSQLLVQLALSVASGREWLGTLHVASPGNVLLAADEEDDEELRRRIYWATQALELTEEQRRALAKRVCAIALAGKQLALLDRTEVRQGDKRFTRYKNSAVADGLLAKLKETPKKWSLIILDPARRFMGLDAETDSAGATAFIQVLEKLTQAPGNPTVLVSHHATKASFRGNTDQTAARGSSALTDGVRWQANLEALRPTKEADDDGYRECDEKGLILKITKTNYTSGRHDHVKLTYGPNGVIALDSSTRQKRKSRARTANILKHVTL